MPGYFNTVFCSVLSLLAFSSAQAQEHELFAPISSTNQNPFINLVGLPNPQNTFLLPPQTWSHSLSVSTSNFSSNNDKDLERIIVDGELAKLQLQLGFGIRKNLDVHLSAAINHHSGGSLDNVIQSWHDTFGLPNGNRSDLINDQLRYFYSVAGEAVVVHSDRSTSVGDSILSMRWRPSSRALNFNILAGIQLPTGEAKNFSGSGHADFFLGINTSHTFQLFGRNATWQGNIGSLFIGGNDLLPEQVKNTAVFGASSVAWQAFHNIAFKTQLSGHSAIYDSAMPELGSDTLQLSMGAGFVLFERWILDLSFSEDLTVEAAPDITFQMSLKRSGTNRKDR